MFTAEDSVYLSSQNYASLDLWSTYPWALRILRPRRPQKKFTGPKLCNDTDVANCLNNADNKYKQCLAQNERMLEIARKFPIDDVPLAPLLHDCSKRYINEGATCVTLYACPSGSNCSDDLGICCENDETACITTTGQFRCESRTKCKSDETINHFTCNCEPIGERKCNDLGNCSCSKNKDRRDYCGGHCIDFKKSNLNCGGCTTPSKNHRCTNSEMCIDGKCVDAEFKCPEGFSPCGNVCCPTGSGCCPGPNPCIDTYGHDPSEVACCPNGGSCVGHCHDLGMYGWGCDAP